MRTRERGAAHINIFFFLIMLVMFFGALGFGYVQLTDNTDLREQVASNRLQLEQQKVDLAVRDHYIEDVLKVVGEAGSYPGRNGHTYVDPDDTRQEGCVVNPLENVSVPSNIDNTVTAFAKQSNVPEALAKPLDSLLGGAKKALDAKDTRVADLEAQNTTLQAQVDKANTLVASANAARKGEVDKLTQDQSELRQFINAEYAKRQSRIDGLRAEVQNRREENDALKEQHSQQVLALTKEKNLLKARIDAARRLTELRNPPQEADGSVISASQAASRAWISLGRKDMLPRGTVFKITSPDTGAVKGYGRVTKVDYDRSEVALYDVADRFDPVTKGDQVRNDLYSPNLRRNIFLMGRFSYPLNKPAVKLILEELGNRVHDNIGPGIDLVLVGGDTLNEDGDGFVPVTESQEYKDALFLGIEISTISKVREFLKRGAD